MGLSADVCDLRIYQSLQPSVEFGCPKVNAFRYGEHFGKVNVLVMVRALLKPRIPVNISSFASSGAAQASDAVRRESEFDYPTREGCAATSDALLSLSFLRLL